MRSPQVSVVVPVYDAERYVGEAIRSVLEQTFADFELILVDDGARDGSAAVCAAFDDPRVRLIRQENRGLAGARNTGIRHARGAVVAFLDADDRWTPDKLERHLAHLDAAPHVGVSFSHSALMDGDGRPLGRAQTPPGGVVTAEDVLLDNPVGNGSSAVVRRAVLDAVAFTAAPRGVDETCWFDEQFRRAQGVEDLDLWLRIALGTSWRLACLPEVLTWYRINPGGLSARGEEMCASWERAVAKAHAVAPDLVAKAARPGRARLLRYLASRAVQARRAGAARRLVRRALYEDPSLLWRQARPTWLTLGAALALSVLPRAAYVRIERLAGGAG